MELLGADTGLHLTVLFKDKINSLQIEACAYEKGVVARSLKHYYLPSQHSMKNEGLVLGFGEADVKIINCAGKVLVEVIRKLYPVQKAA